MKISVCVTVFNEEKSISALLDSLLNQSKKPGQIVIVDGGSTDNTVEIIRHYQKKDSRIKLYVEKCSRARGRNLSVEIASGEIIAMTDAGCIAKISWLKNITEHFKNKKVDIVAGFYEMTAKNSLQKAFSIYLGVKPQDFDNDFLPSTRSVAFRKSTWEGIGGFSEKLKGAAEDTDFNYKAMKNNKRFARVKNAKVEWGMPKNIKEYLTKICSYAKGDASSKIWFYPHKNITSHNILALNITLRYLIALLLIIISFFHSFVFYLFLVLILFYIFYSFRKASLWGIIIQPLTEISVIAGFWSGVLGIK